MYNLSILGGEVKKMMEENESLSISDVEILVKLTYQTGFCDGEDGKEWREYKGDEDYWDNFAKDFIAQHFNSVYK